MKIWERSPMTWRVGMILAIVAQLCAISSTSTRTVNGQVVECSFFDWGKLVIGGLTLVLAVAGWVEHRGRRPKLPDAAAVAIPAVMIALGVLLLLRAFGIVMNPCDDLLSGALG